MQREIGSNFWLYPGVDYRDGVKIDLAKYGLKGNDSVLLSTGRAAENFVLESIEKRNPDLAKIALIPPFTCETVIEPFFKHGYNIFTYPIDGKLEMTEDVLRSSLKKTNAQVVLLHRYFGFDTLKGCSSVIEEFSKKGIIFIEDKTQCIYSSFGNLPTDYIVGSFRKWAALPDGSFAVCNSGIFEDKPEEYDVELEKEKLIACFLKYGYMVYGWDNKPEFLYQYNKAEEILDKQDRVLKMSPVSESVQEKINLEQLKGKRRANYKIIYDGLKDCGFVEVITPSLSKDDVPLYLALRCKEREKLQEDLRHKNIFAPIVWPKSEISPPICKEVQEIYDEILCIPIDQRYDREDMHRILECIRKSGVAK